MKSFIRAITIIVVLNLLLTGSTTAQTAPAAEQTAPASVGRQATGTVDNMLERLKEIQLNVARAGQFDSGGILVIPTAEIKPQDLVTLMEDMTIMCRIFGKKSTQSYTTTGRYRSSLGFSMPFSRDGRSIKAMYVQGYGALFLTKVDFPLSPPPQTEEKEETKEEDTDPVWEQTKQEIFRPEEVGRRRSDRPEEKYDAEKVENLKTTLIKALKHAANIRSLKPDESVIITVTGKAVRSSNVVIQAISRTNGFIVSDKNKNIIRIYKDSLPDELAYSLQTVLVIRAKKSDIDAFANDTLSFDRFSQKIQILSYPYLGKNLSRGSSPSYWPRENVSNLLPPSSPNVEMYGGGSSNRSIRGSRRQ